MEDLIDIAIIGAGSAGLSAAQYGARANLKTVVFERLGAGGQCLLIDHLENYPGIASINGFTFSQQLQQQAQAFGAQFKMADILSLKKEINKTFTLSTAKESFHARSIIIATGSTPRLLGVPGEESLRGRGVSYCATCDGPFFRDKHILVVGGGDAACDEATFLSKLTDKITMIHRRDTFRAQKAVADRVLNNPKINVIWDTQLKEITGNGRVQSVTLFNNKTNTDTQMDVDAVFIFVGSNPHSGLFDMVEKDESGYIITNEKMQTSLEGIFAVGDVRTTPFRQVITACADGAVAAHQVSHYIDALGG